MNSSWVFTSYSLILSIAVLTSLATFISSWRHRKNIIGKSFLLLVASIFGWTLASLVETSVVGLEAKLLASKILYIFIIHVGPLFLIFCVMYTRQDSWLKPRTIALFWAIPVFVLIMVWTNDFHTLYWKGYTPNPDPATNLYIFQPGILHWIFPVYFYFCYLSGFLYLIKGLLFTTHIFQKPILFLIIGTLLPFLGSLVYYSSFNPVPGLDITVLSFSVTGILFSTTINRLGILNISPLARTKLVDEIYDGMVVINPEEKIIDINPAAINFLGDSSISPIGKPVREVFSNWGDFLSIVNSEEPIHLIQLPAENPRFFDIRIKPVYDHHHQLLGKLFILRDITFENQVKEDLARKEVYLQQLFDASPFPLVLSRIADGMIIRANQAALDLFEVNRDELPNFRALDFYKNSGDRNIIIQRVLMEGKIQISEVEFISRSGKHYWINLNIDIFNYLGETCLLVGMVNITEMRNSKIHLQELNSNLELAIVRANEYAVSSEQHAQQLQLLKDVWAVITASLDRNQTLERILEQLSRMVPYDNGMIALRQGQELMVEGIQGETSPNRKLIKHSPLDRQQPEYQVLQSRTTLIYRDHVVQTLMIVPIFHKNEVIGTITLESSQENAFPADIIQLVEAFSDQVAIALENTRLYSETIQRAEQLEILNRIGNALTSGLELETVLKQLQKECQNLFSFDSFYVALINPENRMIEFPLFWEDGKYLQHAPYPLDNETGTTARVIKEMKPVYLPDRTLPASQPTNQMGSTDDQPFRSYVGIPLHLREQVIGVIAMRDKLAYAYSPEQIHLFETIATQAAIAIDNARLFTNLQRLAVSDPLTGVYNRRHFRSLAEGERERSVRYHHCFSILMLDIDFFKRVNDTFGHQAGDFVLITLATILRENLREVDLIGRYGGEEFIILLPETDDKKAFVTAGRLRNIISQVNIPSNGDQITITVSIGINTWCPTVHYSLDESIRRADDALYQAKSSGRNRVCQVQ